MNLMGNSLVSYIVESFPNLRECPSSCLDCQFPAAKRDLKQHKPEAFGVFGLLLQALSYGDLACRRESPAQFT